MIRLILMLIFITACDAPRPEKGSSPLPSMQDVDEVEESKNEDESEDDRDVDYDAMRLKNRESQEPGFSDSSQVEESQGTQADDLQPSQFKTQHRFLVMNSLSEDFSLVNFADLAVEITNNIPMQSADDLQTGCQSPNHAAIWQGYIYVVCSLSHAINIYTLDTFQLLKVIRLGDGVNPWEIHFDNMGRAFVSSFTQDRILVIDAHINPKTPGVRFLGDVKLGTLNLDADSGLDTQPKPSGMVLVGDKLYVALANLHLGFIAGGPGYVAVIDIHSLQIDHLIKTNGRNTVAIKRGRGEKTQEYLYFVSAGNYDLNLGGYVGDGLVDVFDLRKEAIIADIQIGGAPLDMVLTADNHAYLLNGQKGVLMHFDADDFEVFPEVSLVEHLCRPLHQIELTYLSGISADSDYLYITEFNTNCLLQMKRDDYSIQFKGQVGYGPDVILQL